MIDLRSDTVTKPTDEMRKAMAEAEVGDDRYGEDPTVRRLEELYAELVGKEAALYLPSGTMANQVALRSWTSPGGVVLAGKNQHLVQFERAGAAKNSNIQFGLIRETDGELRADDLIEELQLQVHFGLEVSLVCIENTHMPSGGRPWKIDHLEELKAAIGTIPLHMDGARLFNASIATGIKPSEYASLVDSVMSCVSKGLSAPIGSILAGSEEFIARARTERQILGGQMRQAGVIAAAGIVALETMVDRLAEDHRRAKLLASAVADRYPECGLDPNAVETNIVVFEHKDPSSFLNYLRGNDILAGTISPGKIRLVTHKDLDDSSVEQALRAISHAP
ncbi:MAG: aminotransferase class I/II-fold pyridoxal phosphate-dependent enzyme [Acidimicrobiaceae bacterium]|nr:aminotransferase class I/II-fold pyridoxal phosphate-dependent enzyme [Acidimicrobiaceae bacterium]